MRILPLLSIVLFISVSALAQSPPGINYQGVARNFDGKPLVLKDISIRINIVKNSEAGEIEYAETHAVKTNSFGLFTLVIGNGSPVKGDFRFISWAVGQKWLKVEMDTEGGNAFQLMGSQQLMSVPYALYAQYSGNGLAAGQGISITNGTINNTGDGDNNASNELNSSVTLGADRKLRITDGGGTKEADLSPLMANQALDGVLSLGNNANNTRITNLGTPTAGQDAATKAYVDAHNDGDASILNEIQDLVLTGDQLTLTNNPSATTINLSQYKDNTDQQSLTLTGSTLSISNGNSVNLSALGGDQQNLSSTSSGTNRTIQITNGTSTTIDVADDDSNPTNEIQDLSLTGNNLKVTNNVAATTINLAPYLDNTDNQNLSSSAAGTNRTIQISGGTSTTIDVADNDNNATNEIQDLTLTANTLKVTNNAAATSINLAPYLDNTDNQNLTSTAAGTNRTIQISGGTSTTIDVADNDNNPTNEIQDLSLTANVLRVTNNGAATPVSLAPYLDNTDSQSLSWNGGTKNLTISGGNTINIPETQNLSQVLTQNNDAGAQKITNLAAPTVNTDAATKKYVDDADAALAARISTNYAFRTNFSYINLSGLTVSDQPLPFTTETFDDFNVVSGSTFTAAENGIYVFIVDGVHTAASAGQLSLLFNGTKYPVNLVLPVGALSPRYNATQMFKMTAGQTVTLVGDGVVVGGSFSGSFYGHKL